MTARGFTLIEIMVALAVVAVALASGVQASGALTRLAERQHVQILAQLCAENELAKVRLIRSMPAIGTSESRCEQAGVALEVLADVAPTPNPNFRRVDVRVRLPAETNGPKAEPGWTVWQVSTVVGRF
jgi:general secretion pathway protein I